MTNPRYQNSCESCTYLGTAGMYDLYFCAQPRLGFPTVIARYGEGALYHSGIALAEHPEMPMLRFALERALARRLI